jgi:hypothetical protein
MQPEGTSSLALGARDDFQADAPASEELSVEAFGKAVTPE